MLAYILSITLLPSVLSTVTYSCNKAVGIEENTIPDSSMTDSSHYSRFQKASEGRLNNLNDDNGVGAWCAKKEDVRNGIAFIEVDVGKEMWLGKVLTQGRNTTYDQFVKRYNVSYSTDGTNFVFLQEAAEPKIFSANTDMNSIVIQSIRLPLGDPPKARYVRIHPVEFYSNPCMRIELMSCIIKTCQTGYKVSADGLSCEDINECEDQLSCDRSSTRCVNSVGSFKCVCKSGFKPNHASDFRCTDVNECVETAHNCQQKCNNDYGSYHCSCDPGFQLNSDKKTCSDIDECLRRTRCDSTTTTCQNSIGGSPGYTCECIAGYERKDQWSCKDKNECTNGEHNCSTTSTVCQNVPGDYACVCRNGFQRPPGQTPDKYKCEDVDECATNKGGCSHGCQNIAGGYFCTCPKGYHIEKGIDNFNCVDRNECVLDNNGGCQHFCNNTVGGYQCYCKRGFKLSGQYHCVDIDECAEKLDKCDPVTTDCKNNVPLYQCDCKKGFKTTSSIYKCQANVCPALSTVTGTTVSPAGCTQTGGAYAGIHCVFSCQPGYKLPENTANSVTCQSTGLWSGSPTSCQKKRCPALTAPSNGRLFPNFCATSGNVYQEKCHFLCNSGYVAEGDLSRTCEATGTWSVVQTPFRCKKVYPKPTLTCPTDVTVDLGPTESTADVSGLLGKPLSNVQQVTVSPAKYSDYYIFPAGSTALTYTATNQNSESISCITMVNVLDNTKPVFSGCPPDIYKTVTKSTAEVTWTPPKATDNVGVTEQRATHNPGDTFPLGSTRVTYTARDKAGNNADICTFLIQLKKAQCDPNPPQPDGGTLTVSSWGSTQWAAVVCNANKDHFYFHFAITCDIHTWQWSTIPDCVDFIDPKPSSGCPEGYVPQSSLVAYPAKNICVKCPKGTFYDKGSKQCVGCPKGQISSAEGSLKCEPCPSGTSTLKVGSKKCIQLCPIGEFSASGFDLSSGLCQKCSKGTYQDVSGSKSCKSCPSGQTTLRLGSKSASDCGGPPVITEFVSIPDNATEDKSVDLICKGSGKSLSFNITKIIPAPAGFGGPFTQADIRDSTGQKVIGMRHSISIVMEKDAGEYICAVENNFGSASKKYNLKVHLSITVGRRRRR
ncbi:signal peptide, CUB and EGF-like domain-containing protein 2 [Nematostella vectensis]|uniref:signal peptide, CUB and EGF-like domain-containing protein 2 n=1 Tax=Nematostella vectensis TaxID=45351 RepID=UPI002077622C|nr:signal peptide, CUB and EGF-like domain-containing protein 2 [Nematostella vectensis]